MLFHTYVLYTCLIKQWKYYFFSTCQLYEEERYAANYTLNLAKLFGAHVTIVNCYEWTASILEVPSPLIRNLESTCKQNAEDILKTAGEIFADRGIEYQLKTIYESPSRVLANMAKHKEYDLIIMGSHGHSDIAGLFLGSVTHKVLNTIYCPVLIVP